MFLTKEEVPCFLPSFTHSYQTCFSRSENVIHLKTKPAENVSARLGSAQPQHRAKNVLVPRKEGGGAHSAAKGGHGSTKLLLQAASQIGCCNPETNFSSSPDPQIQLFGKYQGNNTAYLPSSQLILFQKHRKKWLKVKW